MLLLLLNGWHYSWLLASQLHFISVAQNCYGGKSVWTKTIMYVDFDELLCYANRSARVVHSSSVPSSLRSLIMDNILVMKRGLSIGEVAKCIFKLDWRYPNH